MKRPCTATTANGRPCRAWAVHDTDPPRCAAHSGRTTAHSGRTTAHSGRTPRAGAPPGNHNARTHGFYGRSIVTPEELAALVTYADTLTLSDELAVNRLSLRAALKYIRQSDLDPHQFAAVHTVVFQATRMILALTRELQDRGEDVFVHEVLDEANNHVPLTL